jgi:hypothetical protein
MVSSRAVIGLLVAASSLAVALSGTYKCICICVAGRPEYNCIAC